MKTSPFQSEDHFLEAISARFPNAHPHMTVGRGDDCAVLACPETMVMTCDMFVENVHFRRAYFSPQDAGHKALAVNLSDIAAMGAKPVGFCLGLAGPPDTPAACWEGVLDGMAELANRTGIPLVGGDLNACSSMVISITVWGEPGESGRLFQRRMCHPGDVLFVVGELGLAAVGLSRLESEGPACVKNWPEAVAAHLRPEAKLAQGLELSGFRGVRGLMDVSDGLARDLPRFLPEGLGAELSIPEDMLHAEVIRHAHATGRDPAELAVIGGEDYALLGACHRTLFLELYGRMPDMWPIGQAVQGQGITINGRPLLSRGFDHFG
ncbi:thiamine-phosphate kinase [Fundidesulfovibrio agrisoli]|uniref:thiamine-phosphate kinase n=1 Tax=Fundidesulfovibrio agrisoli TaxID=2922717 RepID=UPI001FAC195D|nr:thiamine-phosphate kinase [Fundidesulfovibrio agrisoli]